MSRIDATWPRTSACRIALNRALILLYLEDRSYRDIAEVLGITETGVATKINRLKQRIRTGISENAQ